MFSWFKKTGSNTTPWRSMGLPINELEWLEKDFRALDFLRAGVCQQIMCFVVTGTGEEVLQTVIAMPAASGGLSLRGRIGGIRPTPERDRFFSSTTIRDPAFHLRLGLVYHAAALSSTAGKNPVQISPELQGGAEFFGTYLWEALRVLPDVRPCEPKPSVLSAAEMDKMLELHGNPPAWLVRAALVLDVDGLGRLHQVKALIPVIRGFQELLQHHLPVVRECLQQTDYRGKVQALEVLQKVGLAPSHCADLAAELAVNAAKGVRAAAEAWISMEPASILPELRQIAAEAEPAERFLAVKLLAKIGGEEARVFLEERLAAEKSRKVAELIEGLLHSPVQADLAAVEQPGTLPVLPALPDLLADQKLEADVLKDLQDVIDKTNVQWLAQWQKTHEKPWTREPTQLPPGTAENWFAALQTLTSKTPPEKPTRDYRFNPTSLLTGFAAHPKFRLVHVVRWCVLLQPGVFTRSSEWLGCAAACLDARIQKHGPIDYREIAHLCRSLGFESRWIARTWFMLGAYETTLFTNQPASAVWGYFSERLPLLEKALGWAPNHDDPVPTYWENRFRANAWRALAAFPVPPPPFLDRIWEVALGSSKTERPPAQEALLRAPHRDARIIAALSSGQQEQRWIAADWLGRLKIKAAIPALRAAIAKEKYDAPKAMMIGALERLDVSPDEFLDRAGLLQEAKKITSKAVPAALAWFPMAQLPAVHWSDQGQRVAPDIVQAWLLQACKLKQVEPSALVRRYAASFRAEERERLGQFILDAWLAEDVSSHPREFAEAQAMAAAQSLYQSATQYPQYCQGFLGMSLEQIYARVLPGHLETPKGSANDSKGILAITAACAGAGAAAPVGRYLKKWYGTRVHQARALLGMLAWVDHPTATQTLLAIGTRFRTKSLQAEATRLAQELAERKGWSLAELADRTIPTAGLDDDGVLPIDYGPRQFTARLGAELNLALFDPEGKPIKTLPEPRQGDDAEKAAAAKKQLGVTRKELKQVMEQQRVNLYEAMCVQRTWRFEEWEPFLGRHPIVRHFCQRLVWTATHNGTARLFRPLADGSLTDVEDNAFTPEAAEVIAIAHLTTTTPALAAAWVQHFSDYEVAPLFDQFGRSAPEMTPEKKTQREFTDFEGWITDTFKIRGRATKLGYTRGSPGDGGCFNEYVKRFPTMGLQAVIEFTGSTLPETNIPAALTTLAFHREDAGYHKQGLPLGEVPTVLLAECWNDYRQIAADGAGFDPEWEKKAGW